MVTQTGSGDNLVAVNIRTVPENLRDRFKSFCAMRQMSMSDAIVAFMAESVGRFGGKESENAVKKF